MKMPSDEKQFADKAKQLFDESVEELDAATLSRLNRGRHEALAELERATPIWQWLRWAPAAGVAAAAVFAVMLVQQPAIDEAIDVPGAAADFEFLMEGHSLEMFEDLEFYALMDGLEENGHVG